MGQILVFSSHSQIKVSQCNISGLVLMFHMLASSVVIINSNLFKIDTIGLDKLGVSAFFNCDITNINIHG